MPSQHAAPIESRTYFPLANILAIVIALSGGVILAAALTRILTAPVGHDPSWGLYLALQVLHGVKLNGPELVEVNPPFIVWFMSLPVLLSKLLHLNVLSGFACFYAAILAVTGCWSALLFKRLYRPSILGFWLFVLFESVIGVFALTIDELGQREHMVSFMLLPYLLAAAFRIERKRLGSPEACVIGLLAAVAISLKPQHILDIIFVEALVFYRLRSLREWVNPTWLCLGLGLFTYFVAVRLIAPAYLTDVVPLLTATYWGFNEPLTAVARAAKRPIAALLLDALIYLAFRRRLKIKAVALVLLASATGALLAYMQQHKGWSYQAICLQFFAYLLGCLLLADLLEGVIGRVAFRSANSMRPMYAAVAACGAFLISLAIFFHHPRRILYMEVAKQTLADVYSSYPQGTSVDFLSVDPWEFPAVLEQNKIWGSRYLHLWLLPAIVRSQDPEDMDIAHHLSPEKIESLSRLLRTTTAEDLAHWQPQVVVVDPCGMVHICLALQRAHYASMIDWFLMEPQFRKQWSNYTYQKTVGTLEIYRRTK